jgi:hypothetical protein
MLRRSLLLVLVVSVLAATACGGDGDRTGSGTGTGTKSTRSESTGGAVLELPSIPLRDVATGASVDLAELLPADQPLLVWAWAPH